MKRQKTRKIYRWLSMLLAVSMAVTVQGFSVWAEEGSVQAGMEEASMQAEREVPKNPQHICTKKGDGTDYTIWSYVWFGSFPQTEVVGEALTEQIVGAPYDEDGDAVVDGVKYRRVSKADANNTNYFGNSPYRYFKWEPVKWRVLQNDGSTLFVMADQGLDCKDYHDNREAVTWEGCALRGWLNGKFYQTAFNQQEQAAIVEQNNRNADNPSFGMEGGGDTQDKVYILSAEESVDPLYGFCESANTYSVSRRVQPSNYAYVMGTSTGINGGMDGRCFWWMRTPGKEASNSACVCRDGDISLSGVYVDTHINACVPVLHIDLSSDLWTSAGSGTGEGSQPEQPGGDQPEQPGGDAPEQPGGNQPEQPKTDISKKAKVTLKSTSCTYNGKKKQPAVTVKVGSATLKKGTDYKVVYKNNTNVGKASVVISGLGSYTGKVTKTFKILPPKTEISGKATSKSKSFTVKWKKQAKAVTGYQVQYSVKKNFKTKAAKLVKKASIVKLTVKKLKVKKKYYIRVRTYKDVKGVRYYSSWSKTKAVTIKK